MSTLKVDTISNVAGTSSVPTATVISGTAKAWVNFNGTGTVAIRASFNVSSITDNGVGAYTVNFSTVMPDANYSWLGTSGNATNFVIANTNNVGADVAPTTSGFKIIVNNNSNTAQIDNPYINIAVFR